MGNVIDLNIPATTKTYNTDQLMELWYKYYDVFTAEISFQLIWAKKKDIPWLQCNKGEDTYTNHNIIMIGLGLIEKLFQPTSEEEFLLYTLYLIGHEVGHIKHTPNKPWIHGIKEGTRQICIALSEKYEGKGKRRFVKDSDIDNFLEVLKKNYNISISRKNLESFCHGIQNSLEDGREERLEAQTDRQFKLRMKVGRGKAWLEQPINPTQAIEAKTDPIKKGLNVKLFQILSLATTSFYQKGFFEIFDDGDLVFETIENEIYPLIIKAVTSPTCRQCIETAIEIEKKLIDDLVEIAKSNNLDEYLQEIFSNCGIKPSENDNPSGLLRCENTGTTSNNDSNSNSATEINGHFPIFDRKDEDNKNSEDKIESSGCIYDHSSQRTGKRNEGCRGSEVKDIAATEQAVLEAMKDAAAQQAGLISNAVKKKADKKQSTYVYVPKDPVIPNKRLKEDYGNVVFKEYTKQYEVKLPMPSDLQLRANEFEKEIEEILQNKAKTIYNQRSGKLDSGSIYKLFMGELDIFTEEQTPHEFDGCCYLLQDNSGSMGYGSCSKREYACEANAVVEQGFEKLMPLKIVAFDASGSNFVNHEIIKDFDEIQPMNCSYNFLMQGRGGCGNKDGYDIRIATQELLSRSEKQKLLIVLSDGTPSASNMSYKSGVADVTDAVAEAKEQGIKVVGIYFADNLCDKEVDSYKKMYGDEIIATTPDRIEQELIKLLKNFYFG